MRIITSGTIVGLAAAYPKLAGRQSTAMLVIVLLAGSISIFSNSMLSHNSAVTFLPTVAVVSDWVHFMAVSAWVGGLFYFASVLLAKSDGGKIAYNLALVLPRFSLIATASLGIIGVSGLYMAWIHLQSFDSLFSTQYGSNLIIKLASALPMVLLGGYHQVKLHSGIVMLASIGRHGPSHEGTGNSVSKFKKTIKIESMIGIGVLLAASFLTITSPPSHSHVGQVGTPGNTSGFSQNASVDGVDLSISITPFHVGFNTFSVTIGESGRPADNINAVFLRLRNSETGIGPIIATLNQTGPGVYSITGGYLSQPGTWEADLIVQRINAYDINHGFEIPLTGAHEMDMMDMTEMEHATEQDSTITESNSEDSAQPTFDSFAILAIGLSALVISGSLYFYRKSKKQLAETIRALEQKS
jgi:putative copper export protein